MNIYAANIMDHYKHPRNKGRLLDTDISHHEINHSCGDDILISLDIDGSVIRQIKFDGHGCAISQAGISILSEDLIGKKTKDVLAYDFEYMKKLLGVPISERRHKCAMIGLWAIQRGIEKNLA